MEKQAQKHWKQSKSVCLERLSTSAKTMENQKNETLEENKNIFLNVSQRRSHAQHTIHVYEHIYDHRCQIQHSCLRAYL